MGDWSYVPDVLGEVASQTDANGKTIAMAYDVLGRMTQRTESEDTTTWTYDTLWKGALYQVTTTTGLLKTQKYQKTLSNPTPFGAMQKEDVKIDSNSYGHVVIT